MAKRTILMLLSVCICVLGSTAVATASEESRVSFDPDLLLAGAPLSPAGVSPECTSDINCSDGQYCNGEEACGAGFCQPGPGDPCDASETRDETSDTRLPCTTDAECDHGTS